MRKVLFFILLVLAGLGAVPPLNAQCLECKAGWTPPAGHGPASGSDPRRKLTIFIDWGSDTPDKIWNAVHEAVDSWNNTTDQYGNKTGYYFVVDQGKTIADPPDLTIRSMGSMSNSLAVCGQSDIYACGTFTAPGMIRLASENDSSSAISQNHVATRIAHEIGHLIGLHGDPCYSQQTLYTFANPDGSRNGPSGVTHHDVAAANSALNDPASCTGTGPAMEEIDWSSTSGGDVSEDVHYNEPIELSEQWYNCTNYYEVTRYYYWSDSEGWVNWHTDVDYLYSEGCYPLVQGETLAMASSVRLRSSPAPTPPWARFNKPYSRAFSQSIRQPAHRIRSSSESLFETPDLSSSSFCRSGLTMSRVASADTLGAEASRKTASGL